MKTSLRYPGPQWEDYTESKQYVTIVKRDAAEAEGIQEFDIEVIPQTYPPVITQGAYMESLLMRMKLLWLGRH